MPLNTDSIIQMASGSDTSTGGADPFTLTLPAATTAGSTIIIIATADGDNSTTTWLEPPAPAGGETFSPYFETNPARPWNQLGVWVKRNTAGGESSWDMTVSLGPHVAQQVVWVVLEMTGVGVDPYPLINGSFPEGWVAFPASKTVNNTNVGVTTWSSGTTHQTACYDVLALAFHSATSTTGTIPAFSNRTNGFVELISDSHTDASHSLALTVSYLPSLAIHTFECNVDVTPSSYMNGYVLAFYADGAKFAPDYMGMFGAEIGSATNIAVASPSANPPMVVFDTVVGSPAIVATTPRSGNYCLELSSSAAAECLTWSGGAVGVLTGGARSNTSVGRFCFYFPTARPTTDCEIWSSSAGPGSFNGIAQIWYRTASQKLEVKVGTTGTAVLSDAIMPINTWVGVDYRHFCGGTGEHTYDWMVDYDASLADGTGPVVQTSAVGGSTSPESIELVRVGWQSARTATVRYDDIAVSPLWANYPIGDVRILPLKVDPLGTPSVTGSSANFRLMTANGTLATWTAAGTITTLDDVPPTIGAASDGVVQITAAVNDWVKVPMETYTAAPDFVLRAVRWYVAGWATTTTTGTLAVRSGDSSGIWWNVADGDHNFDNTTQRWLCGPHRDRSSIVPYIMTQSKLDSMYLEFGGSVDATPDVGLHCVLAEVAIQPANIIGVLEAEAGAFSVYVRQDPSSGAVASYLVTTPAGTRGAEFTYALEGVDQTPVYVGPNTTYEEVIGSDSIETVTSVGLSPDPSE